MKINKKAYFAIGLVGFCSLLVSIVLKYPTNGNAAKNLSALYQNTKEKVEKALVAFYQTHDQWQQLAFASSDTLLTSQKLPSTYFYYLFENQKLAFWSDARLIPETQWIQHQEELKIVNYENNQYLIIQSKRARGTDTLCAISLLEIYKEYKIQNVYLQSGLNPTIFDDLEFNISQNPQLSYQNIYAPNGKFLFSLERKEGAEIPNRTTSAWIALSFVLGVCATWLWLHTFTAPWLRKRSYTATFLLWLAYLVALRLLMLWLKFPSDYAQGFLFDSDFYNVSWLAPSLSDLLLNLGLVGSGFLFLIKHLAHFKWLRKMMASSTKWYPLWLGLSVIGVWIVVQGYLYVLSTLFVNSQLHLDITRTLDFSHQSLWGIIIFALCTLVSFVGLHFFLRIFTLFAARLHRQSFLLGLLLPLLFCGAMAYFATYPQLFLLLIIFLFLLGITYQQLPRYLYRFVYTTFIYFFVGALLFASLGAYAVYHYGKQKSLKERRAFATLLIPEQDLLAEILLGEATRKIKADTALKAALKDTSYLKDELAYEIQKKYLSKNFDSYQTQVLLFGADNQSLDPQNPALNFQDYYNRYQRVDYGTSRPEIFFIDLSGINLVRHYVAFVEVEDTNNTSFNIILDIKQNRDLSNNVYPELLIDKTYHRSQEGKNYGYALYDHRQLLYSIGDFNYARDFRNEYFDEEALFLEGLQVGDFEHLCVEISSKKVVVSIPTYAWNAIFSNFAFLFLVLMFEILGFMLIYSLINRLQGFKGNFATRIQFYLNIAFFLPLLTVSIATLSIISENYRLDFSKRFAEDTRKIARNLSPYLEQYLQQGLDQETFINQSLQIARHAGRDINVFDPSGRLITTSQPAIYEIKILSRYINPKALFDIKYKGETESMQKETVGQLNYLTVYMPLKSYESEQVLGLVSVPFFDFQYELEQRLIEVLSTIINIFVSILILFLVLSYFASNLLVIPLRLITQKIRKTSFYDYSEPLVWESKDEIGIFVKEYNRMLQKLDKSKEALARSQRESAWREIAQQVAHEIKNPLTPIRLTLQMMQKRLEGQTEKVKATFERSIDTLIEQADILNDIATSFSSFAKMPVPSSERFELIELLQSTETLYADEKIEVVLQLIPGRFYVQGDRKLMGRIFTNLVKNALEATPAERHAKVEISLSAEVEGIIKLAFKDNGEGVSLEAQDKLFMPNFTTKSTGSGIGLAVSKRGIEHAGGRIWFETELGTGTTFYIELPLVE